jgi:hypothetical protein
MEPLPRAPRWALWAGLPEPQQHEGFREYVQRLGLDPEPLLVGLSERSLVLANMRLDSALIRACPEAFARYMRSRKQASG